MSNASTPKQPNTGLFGFQMASSVLAQATPQQVWDVFGDAAAWPSWSRVCTRVWGLSPELWAVGSRLSFRLRMAGVRVPFSVQVTESGLPHRIAWASTKLTITAVRTFTFVSQGNATLITDHKSFSSSVLPIRLFYPRRVIRRMTEAWLRELKAEVERRARTHRMAS
ncbi:MAG: SRPBCC family protein [Chloroflexi bacterium]|nr:SRPBCC family protein [Chloroflexota bacterium]